VQLELVHLAERGDHAEIEYAALAARQRLVRPAEAPAVFAHDFLERLVEVVGVLHRAVDVFVAQHFAPHGESGIHQLLVHRFSSVEKNLS
jgi:hypothetical protein